MRDADYWIRSLELLPHPEGGFYKETYRSKNNILQNSLSNFGITGERSFSTAIYFLLRKQDRSAFHKIKSDEIWHFHAGDPLNIYCLDGKKGLRISKLGLAMEDQQSPQLVVEANTWFGALVEAGEAGYTLVSCTVAPGFDFRDFQMAEKKELHSQYPEFHQIISLLT